MFRSLVYSFLWSGYYECQLRQLFCSKETITSRSACWSTEPHETEQQTYFALDLLATNWKEKYV